MAIKSIFDITVSPKSSRSTITVDAGNNIKVYLNAPPVDGKANSELIGLFSKKLRIPKSDITIISGEKGKKKRIEIEGLSPESILKKISSR
ncbi:MAG TPA: DUF167 domain-containing protein [Spirochaetota bacterium]|nr:DUF167 domain-containing protein [Spirochaetota bacterium]HPC39523.1 DUF167 domain-containing protein [Spirochaetota bacterium]HPL15241.1 DUF167 domain-containing protein [Spirochaetota bacterium]HQF06860.1 DUF167 domain-containing protein [Spirochaetota bacterium]HQH95521.1 DUF167 domain-containing protein [Spirochaetota bacterium]